MLNMKLLAIKVAVSLLAVGSLSFAGAEVVGATVQSGNQPVSHSTAAGRQRACLRLHKHQEFATQSQARFAARTAKFAALSAKAQKGGNAKLAKYWQSVVTHRYATAARTQANATARTDRRNQHHGKVGGPC